MAILFVEFLIEKLKLIRKSQNPKLKIYTNEIGVFFNNRMSEFLCFVMKQRSFFCI